MRVLVTWGSKRGGTEGIAQTVGEELRARGFSVVLASAEKVRDLDVFDAVIVGGALYGNCWPANVRRFVRRHVAWLRSVPVWFFSSGPLDDSADRTSIPPSTQVAVLAERVGALGHVTFGGRLAADAKGFPAAAIARESAGDFRNLLRVRSWAGELAEQLHTARPGKPVEHPAHSLPRLLGHGLLGWAAPAMVMLVLLLLVSERAALVTHALLSPVVFALLAVHYFRGRGAREPLAVATCWTLIAAVLDVALVAIAAPGSLAMFRSVAGTWLPLALIFGVTWMTGALMATMPWPKSSQQRATPAVPER